MFFYILITLIEVYKFQKLDLRTVFSNNTLETFRILQKDA